MTKKKSQKKEENLSNNKGHRKRLRDRVLRSPDSLKEYELLELLFFGCHPRKDTKVIAKKVLSDFSNVAELINLDSETLKNVYGVSEAIISIILVLKQIVERSARCNIEKKKLLNETKLISEYIKAKIGFIKKENLIALFLDGGYKLIKDEIMNEGTTNYISAYPKEIAAKALLLNASYVVLAHNHPSGDVYPSSDDLVMTEKVIESLRGVEIKLLDHIIVSKCDDLSFRENLIINEDGSFNEDFCVEDLKREYRSDYDLDEKIKSSVSFDEVENLFKSILEKERDKK
jgi:DNA repair protein RadC